MTPPAAWRAPLVRPGALLVALIAALAGCEASDTREPSATRENNAGTEPIPFDSGVELAFAEPEVGRVRFTLDSPAVVDAPTGAWDLAFGSYGVSEAA